MNTLEAFHMRCQRQILDVRWWVYVFNAEVLQRSGLSTIGDILRHRRLSLVGHVARLVPGVLAHDALRPIEDIRRQKGQLEKTAGSPCQRLAQQDSGGHQRSTAIYAVVIWEHRGSWSGAKVTRTMRRRWCDEDDYCQKWRVKLMHQQPVLNRDCWTFENHWRRV